MINLVQKAFENVNRGDFVLPEDKNKADLDVPLLIGHGQTISQPTTVKMMLEWLDPQKGEKILDIGSGSGWTTALLSNIVGEEGKVYAVELISELKVFGEENCKKIGIKNANFFLAGKVFGLQKFAPYDRILVSASAESIPNELIDQLKLGGKMVIPVGNSIFEVMKDNKGTTKTKEHYGFVFVPLVGNNEEKD